LRFEITLRAAEMFEALPPADSLTPEQPGYTTEEDGYSRQEEDGA